MENYLKLEPIYAELNRFTNEKAEELIKELKINSSTYKELYSKLDLFDKQIRFTRDSNKFVNEALIAESKRLLDKEVNDLPLTNRPSNNVIEEKIMTVNLPYFINGVDLYNLLYSLVKNQSHQNNV